MNLLALESHRQRVIGTCQNDYVLVGNWSLVPPKVALSALGERKLSNQEQTEAER